MSAILAISSDNKIPFPYEIYDDLIDICQNNLQHFECNNTMTDKRYADAFRCILQQLALVRRYATEFYGFMHEYDFDETTPANGYRSIVKATHGCITQTTKASRYVAKNRGHLLFRKMSHVQ